jgi:uncharacterized membrane protein
MAIKYRVGGVLLTLSLLLYPLVIYFGLQHVQPRVFGALLLVLVGLRLWQMHGMTSRQQRLQLLPLVVVGVVCGVAATLSNSFALLRYLPVFNSVIWFAGFSYTLLYPPSMIERFARLQRADLDAHGVQYTRTVTQVWCGFFVVNFFIALYTALYSDLSVWALYNGCLVYVAIGVLFAAEYLVRLQVMKRGAAQ